MDWVLIIWGVGHKELKERTQALLEDELTVMYKFRCMLFHGDINMDIKMSPAENEVAKFAYEALDALLLPLTEQHKNS
jgi:hypothetical protein